MGSRSMETIRTLLDAATARLSEQHTSARLDGEVLLGHVLKRPRSYLYTWPDAPLPKPQRDRFLELVRRRAGGEPVAHLTGRREFWSLELEVSEQTLIPRPETELLVELALARIPGGVSWKIADLGTGSGAIALALASERRSCRIIATDRSPEALELAGRNADRLRLDSIQFHRGDWCEALAGERFRFILSNPPYVAMGDPHLESGDLRFEPLGALVSGADGLDDIRRIAGDARDHLEPDGELLLEHGCDQGDAVGGILSGFGYTGVETHRDLSGLQRVTLGRWRGGGVEDE